MFPGPARFRQMHPLVLLLGLSACAGQNGAFLTQGPDTSTASSLQIAMASERSGDYAHAAHIFENVLAQDPKNKMALLGAGESYAALGQTILAENALKRGLELDPTNLAMLNEMGRIKFVAHDPAGAIIYFDKALNINSKNVSALTGKALAYDYQSQYGQAQQIYGRALQIYPTNFILLSNYALSLAASGQQEKGIAILQELVRDPRAAAHVRGNLALAYGLAGRDEDARATLNTDLSASKINHNIRIYHAMRQLMREGKPIGALVFA